MLACIEIGGSTSQTVVFDGDAVVLVDGVAPPAGAAVALAVPGIIAAGRVVGASNLGWFDVDPMHELGLDGAAVVLCNDAEAAGLGEAVRHGLDDVVFVGLGTGVGGAVVTGGAITAGNLFGHAAGFSDLRCVCSQTGCLETVAAGWALPARLTYDDVSRAALAVASAIRNEPLAATGTVVVGGGLAAAYPHLVDLVARGLPARAVVRSGAPDGAKSAAAWGLRRLAVAAGFVR